MVKTSTPINLSNFAECSSTENLDANLDVQNELYLKSIKWQLDSLKREPSKEVIQNILDYSKAK